MALPSAILQLMYGQVGGEGQYQTLAGLLYGVDSATVDPQNLDVDRVNALIEQALADTTGFRQAATAIANGTLSRVDNAQIALHTEVQARGYAIDGGVLTAPINADLHLGYSIEMNVRAGENITNVFLPSKAYVNFRNGRLTPSVISVQGTTFNVDYRYQHNSTSEHDEIELRCVQVTGRPTDLTTFYDFEVYELNVAVVEQQPGQTAADVQTAIRNALIDYVQTGTYNIRRATVDSRITDLGNRKAEQTELNRVESEVDTVEAVLPTKADKRPVHIDLDRYQVARRITEAFSFEAVIREIEASLLQNVTHFQVTLRGLPVHSQVFNPSTAASQVFVVEIAGTELANLSRAIRPEDTTLDLQFIFRDASNTGVYTESIPMAIV